MALFSASPVRIQPFFGYRSRDRLVLQARALRSGKLRFERGGRWLAMRTMLAQFASREAAGVAVTLEITLQNNAVQQHHAVSDAEGYVHFELPLDPVWELPEHPAWEAVQLRWQNDQGEQSLTGHVLAPGQQSELAVISDIDDTIIETGITGGLRSLARNWRRVLAQWPDERIAVPGADVFYSALGGGEPGGASTTPGGMRLAATHRPFFYVSSSPWNLFSYLVAFKRAKNLPLGPLMLRDWGFNRATFGSGSHGDHKSSAITGILAMYPHLRFALIGDDTQGDLPAFAAAVAARPERIAAVFLRRISTDALSPEEEQAAATIRQAGVPLWMGASYGAGHAFLQTLGFTPGGETEQIVKAVEKTDGDPAA